jgi:hypothetical protein
LDRFNYCCCFPVDLEVVQKNIVTGGQGVSSCHQKRHKIMGVKKLAMMFVVSVILPMALAQQVSAPINVPINNKPDPSQFAMCIVGHYRTFFSPVVMGSQLAAFEHLSPNLRRFAVLGIDESNDGKMKASYAAKGHKSVQANESDLWFRERYASELQTYNLSGLRTLSATGDESDSFVEALFRVGGGCSPPDGACLHVQRPPPKGRQNTEPFCQQPDLRSRSFAHESAENWAEQCYKVHHCGMLIGAYEKTHSTRFSWVLKTRPDIVFLEPFPSLATFNVKSMVWVPMHRTDHLFLCQREHCDGLLFRATRNQLKCSCGDVPRSCQNGSAIHFGFYGTSNRLEYMGYGPGKSVGISDLQLQYAFAREANSGGMRCVPNTYLPPSCLQIANYTRELISGPSDANENLRIRSLVVDSVRNSAPPMREKLYPIGKSL